MSRSFSAASRSDRRLLEQVRTHEDDAADPVDVDRVGVVGRPLDAVKADRETLVGADVLAVPDRVPEAPLTENDVRPLEQRLARLDVVLVVAGPVVLADLCTQSQCPVRNPGEELEVVTGDHQAPLALAR